MLNRDKELDLFSSWVRRTYIPGAENGNRIVELKDKKLKYKDAYKRLVKAFLDEINTDTAVGFLKDIYGLYEVFMGQVAEEYFALKNNNPYGFVCLYFMNFINEETGKPEPISIPVHEELVLTKIPRKQNELSYIHMFEFWTRTTPEFINEHNPWSAENIMLHLEGKLVFGDTKWLQTKLDLSLKSKTASSIPVAL